MFGSTKRVALVGCGDRMVGRHLPHVLSSGDEVVAICDPDPGSVESTMMMMRRATASLPLVEPDLAGLLSRDDLDLDAAIVASPNHFHAVHAASCLDRGLHVLIEKPMAVNVKEATMLVRRARESSRVVSVAAQGSLSVYRQAALDLISSGETGTTTLIQVTVWEDWQKGNAGSWRHVPQKAGGGFVYDSGAHALHTLIDFGGNVSAVSGYLCQGDLDVDVEGVFLFRFESGAMGTLTAAGRAPVSRARSEVQVFGTRGTLRTSVWGRRLHIETANGEREVPCPSEPGPWRMFRQAIDGNTNHCSVEDGYRVAALWESMKRSASLDGHLVQCESSI